MNWLNLNVQTLDSENFLGSDPTDRATWLCLLRYCIGQENSGIISDCKEWADRKWQQLVRVTKKEAERACGLWEWDGESLVVWGYPSEKEDEVKTNRANGSRGGRPRKAKQNHPVSNRETTRFDIAETERKEKGKEIEKEESLTLPFSSERFKESWDSWLKYQKERKKKLTPSTISINFGRFQKWGESKSIEAIRQSIENGWQGIFEPKVNPATKAGTSDGFGLSGNFTSNQVGI